MLIRNAVPMGYSEILAYACREPHSTVTYLHTYVSLVADPESNGRGDEILASNGMGNARILGKRSSQKRLFHCFKKLQLISI